MKVMPESADNEMKERIKKAFNEGTTHVNPDTFYKSTGVKFSDSKFNFNSDEFTESEKINIRFIFESILESCASSGDPAYEVLERFISGGMTLQRHYLRKHQYHYYFYQKAIDSKLCLIAEIGHPYLDFYIDGKGAIPFRAYKRVLRNSGNFNKYMNEPC